eukprot:3877768-Amphidinium_carterae.1
MLEDDVPELINADVVEDVDALEILNGVGVVELTELDVESMVDIRANVSHTFDRNYERQQA